YEQEADQVAAQVMRMPDTDDEEDPDLQMQPAAPVEEDADEDTLHRQAIADTITPLVQRQTIDDSSEDEELQARLQGKTAQAPAVDDNFESQLSGQRGNGQPLPKSLKSSFENKFQASFDNVRVHTDTASVQMSQAIGAQAFTHGNDIYFNSGKYNPGSNSGQELLAHELTHTIQQKGVQQQVSSRQIQRQGYGYEDEENMMSVWHDDSVNMTSATEPMSTVVFVYTSNDSQNAKSSLKGKSSVEDNVANLELLKGKTTDDFNVSKDTEHIERNAPNPSEILPFTADGWNANEILRNLGQYDQLSGTDSDSSRCVQAVALGNYVLDGPDAVQSYLDSISAQGISSANQITERKEVALRVINDVKTRVDNRTASYGDLSWLQEAVHDLFYEDSAGVPMHEVQEQITASLSGNVHAMSLWCSSLDEVMEQVASLKPGERLLMTTYQVVFNAAYDQLNEQEVEVSDRMKVKVNGQKKEINRIRTDVRPDPKDIDLNRDTLGGHQLLIFREQGESGNLKLYEPETTLDGTHLKEISNSGSELEQYLREHPEYGIYSYLKIHGKVGNSSSSSY
ncbi:MAG: DUF4157 domain-containing protein, partial [Elainellaceae cyanobacterium]